MAMCRKMIFAGKYKTVACGRLVGHADPCHERGACERVIALRKGYTEQCGSLLNTALYRVAGSTGIVVALCDSCSAKIGAVPLKVVPWEQEDR